MVMTGIYIDCIDLVYSLLILVCDRYVFACVFLAASFSYSLFFSSSRLQPVLLFILLFC